MLLHHLISLKNIIPITSLWRFKHFIKPLEDFLKFSIYLNQNFNEYTYCIQL